MMDAPRYKRLLILGLITMFTASCGNSSDDDIPLEPNENVVPVVNSTSIDVAAVGELYSYALTASDEDGDTLTMSFTSLPAWLTFNASSGELTGTPSGTNVGNHNVMLAVSDGTDSVSQSFVIVVAAAAAEEGGSSDWALVWSDEFEGASIDASKWTHEVNCNGGGNQEKQCYTDSTENSFVENGILKIVAKAESGLSLPYSSARLISKDQGDWKYGRFEIRAKAPTGQGSWPAIWMLPTDNVYGGWPHSGEIDIFESVNLGVALNDGSGGVESNVHGTLHYGESWPNNDHTGQSYLLPSGENPADDFHIYAIEWEEGEIRWYVDGILYQTQRQSEVTLNSDGNADGLSHKGWYTEKDGEILWSSAPFDESFHLLLNFAVGGSWPEAVNQGGVDASAFGASNSFEVDYVRVYECSISPNNGQGCATVTDNYSDPIGAGGTLVNGAAPTPIAPSDGVVRELTIFENAMIASWPAWDSSGNSTPALVNDDAEYAQVVEFVVGASPAVFGFNTSIADSPSPYDGSPILNDGVLEFDLKLVTPPNNTSAGWNLKVEQGGTSSEAVVSLDTPTADWQHYAVSLKDLSNAGLDLNGIDIVMIFPDWGEGEGAVFRVDNVTILQGEADPEPTPNNELLTNGSFETGTEGWIGAVNVVIEDGNNIFQADVAVAGNPSDVNLSQVMTLVPNETYVVSFNAKASNALSIIVGLGLNQEPWTNSTETVALTTAWQTFTYEITATDFGDENSRVLFDLGSEVGTVNIDDVSVVLKEQNSGGPVAEDEFIIISSTVASSIEFLPDTVGEWSTGSQIQGDVMFDGLLGWEVTSSSNSPEQGNWGTVLAIQNGIVGDFSLHNRISLKLATTGNYSGGYKIAISASGVNLEIALPIDETITTWQSVSLNTLDIPLNMSSIDWVAVYGIGGQMGVSTIHVTDFSIIKDEAILFNSDTKNDFVFISSDQNITSDLIVDDDNNSDVGNVIFGEWSTGTGISNVTYSGLDAVQLSAGGSWGAVLALQGDISDGTSIDNYDVDFAEYTNIKFKMASNGAFERYAVSIVSRIGDNEAAQEVSFSLNDQSEWNTIDIDLARYGVDISNVSQMALFGVYQGGSAAQQIYITDFVMYDSGKVLATKDSSDDKFVFFSSTGETSDMVFDEDNFAHNGNMTIGEWSTGTALASDVTYAGLNAFELTRGSESWGAVLALMGDIHGDVQEYDFDVAEYSTLNFKIAAVGGMSEYTLDFLVNGSEFKIPLSVNSNWSEVSINLADVPLNLSKLTQIAIFGVGGGAGNKIYVTDMNLSK